MFAGLPTITPLLSAQAFGVAMVDDGGDSSLWSVVVAVSFTLAALWLLMKITQPAANAARRPEGVTAKSARAEIQTRATSNPSSRDSTLRRGHRDSRVMNTTWVTNGERAARPCSGLARARRSGAARAAQKVADLAQYEAVGQGLSVSNLRSGRISTRRASSCSRVSPP